MKIESTERLPAPEVEADAFRAGVGDGLLMELGPGADLEVTPGANFEASPGLTEAAGVAGSVRRGNAATFTRNSLISMARLLISTVVALVLPAYLTHRLPVKTYSAWVLILQMSAYVSYLDFGVQTGIAKYVAEYEARGDARGASLRASAGLAIMMCASVLGVLLTGLLAWRVPDLFHEMPSNLYHDVRLSVLFVGVALSLSLVFSIFSSIFIGLQQFTVPMVLSLVNRFLFTGAVVLAVALKSSLAWMGATVAAVHLATSLLQFVAWRRMKDRITMSLRGLDRGVLKQMVAYCSSLAIWTAGMLCVTGLDITIVGRYDFGRTAYYSIATLPTNFMISIMGAALGPLLPMASALAVHRSPLEMGAILTRATRYASTLLLLAALPLMVGGYWILRAWVGPVYAVQAMGFLRILVLANVIRNTCLPYSSMLISTESQKVAIVGASAEAVVNLGSSLYLVQHIGAIGVAYGTLLGSVVSVGMHFALSMRYTYAKFSVTRMKLFLSGMVRPAALLVPAGSAVTSVVVAGRSGDGMGGLAGVGGEHAACSVVCVPERAGTRCSVAAGAAALRPTGKRASNGTISCSGMRRTTRWPREECDR